MAYLVFHVLNYYALDNRSEWENKKSNEICNQIGKRSQNIFCRNDQKDKDVSI